MPFVVEDDDEIFRQAYKKKLEIRRKELGTDCEAATVLDEFYFTYLAYAGHKNHRNTLKRVAKLCEESGEVAEAVLACLGSENKTSKIAESGQTPHERLEEEIGDVIISALHIAHTEKLDKLRLFKRATEKMREKIDSASNLSK